jgi:hypothetical protein
MNSIPPPGHDEGLEAVGAEIRQHLQHRLVDQFGVGLLEFRIASRREPVGDDLGEFVHGHTGVGHGDQLDEALFAVCGQGLHVTVQHGLERLLGLPVGVLRCQRPDAVEDECELDRHRVFDPQGAVVVERGDALIDGYEVRSALDGDAQNKIGNGFLRGTVVPGRQRIGLRLCGIRTKKPHEGRGYRHGREQKTAAKVA